MPDSEVGALTAASALGGTETFHVVQSGNSRRATTTQMRTFVNNEPTARIKVTRGGQGAWRANSAMAQATLNGGSVTLTGLIPARAIVHCVTVYVTTALGGTLTSFDVGTPSSQSQFGGSVGIAAGSLNIGVVSPFPTYSPLDIVLTANGGTGTGNTNRIRVVAYYDSFDTPTG